MVVQYVMVIKYSVRARKLASWGRPGGVIPIMGGFCG